MKKTISNNVVNYNLLIDSINLLKQKGWTQTQIAKKMETSQTYLSYLINYRNKIQHKTLKKYMNNLHDFLED
jgi:transcriptional regulator with XRE-family HTH domain